MITIYFALDFIYLDSDDAGCNGVSFKCDNGTDLDAAADVVWVNDNVWTSFVSCPGKYETCVSGVLKIYLQEIL